VKILYVVGNPGLKLDKESPGGNTVHILSTIKAFRQLGCEVTFLIAGEKAQEKKADASYAKIKKVLPLSAAFFFKNIYKTVYSFKFYEFYKKYFENVSPDLIYERYCHFHFGCSLIAKRLKLPYIVEINSPPEAMRLHGPAPIVPLVRLIEKWVAKSADAIIVVSNSLRFYLSRIGISPEKIYVLANAVDCELFNPGNVKKNIRDRYNLNGKIIVGYVGSTSKNQRLDFLVETAQRVVKIIKNIHFLLICPFKDIEVFKKMLENKNMTKYFTLTGGVPHEEVPEYISAMDICVHVHSNPHGSPIKIFAYGAMGKAVVAPDFEPVKEVSQHEESILLFKPLNVKDFANSIARLARDPSLRKSLGDNLRRHISKNHTWQKNAERILKIYETIRGKKITRNLYCQD